MPRKQILQQLAAELVNEDEFKTPRQKILDEASEIVHHDRNSAYGNPEDNFKNTAKAWSAYLQGRYPRVIFTSQDVAIMQILLKTARLSINQNHHDSCVDIVGYGACLGDIQQIDKSNGVSVSSSEEENPERSFQR